jgi:hypothetical protein
MDGLFESWKKRVRIAAGLENSLAGSAATAVALQGGQAVSIEELREHLEEEELGTCSSYQRAIARYLSQSVALRKTGENWALDLGMEDNCAVRTRLSGPGTESLWQQARSGAKRTQNGRQAG